MKKWFVFGGIGIILALCAMFYNDIAKAYIGVEQQYGQIQVAMQRQDDLIPNLVSVAQKYSDHEKGVLVEVTQARGELTSLAKIDPLKIANDPELQKRIIDAQAQLGAAVMKLRSTAEAYPNLKADAQFMNLSKQLEGSVNRISVERQKAQVITGNYNKMLVSFPKNLLAKAFGFEPFKFFVAAEGVTGKAKVEFK